MEPWNIEWDYELLKCYGAVAKKIAIRKCLFKFTETKEDG
jgi:hypothetical protein